MKKFTNKFKTKKEDKMIYPFGSEECSKFLKESYKDSIDKTLILKEELYEKIDEYDKLNADIKILENKKKTIEHILQNEMKLYENAFCKDRKITWKKVVKNSIDTKKLKLENEELASRYTKTSTSRTFRIK